ncbi:Sorting nexin, cytoplasm-to-vacuole targeting pathway/endosomal sorting [Rhizoclosmatium hyalinum]|nr:Sorting nexin, cytoplasm-to-vacuole targeting pathway/endosomal sorting [Rhizoclosmatium hyalinum]
MSDDEAINDPLMDPLSASFADESEEAAPVTHVPYTPFLATEYQAQIDALEASVTSSSRLVGAVEALQPPTPSQTQSQSGFDEDSDAFGAALGRSRTWSSSEAVEQQQPPTETDDLDSDADLPSNVNVNVAAVVNPHIPQKLKPCCKLDSILAQSCPTLFNPLFDSGPIASQQKPAILIEETQKISDAGSSSYTAYIIRLTIPEHDLQLEARHRYSDFESFNRLLRRMHPTLQIPPIPDKQSIADYAVNPLSKPKEDPKLIDSRKRLLQLFLNRVAMHPILKREHIFHGFLEGDRMGKSWAQVLEASGVAHFLKVKDAKKAANSLKLTDSLLKNPDPHFLAAEEYTFKFGQQLGLLTKYQKRMNKHLQDCAQAGTDLGQTYNAWSLTETSVSLQPEIEALGEAFDSTVTSQHKLVHVLEEYVTEPLGTYEKLTTGIEKTLKWRHQLHVDYEASIEGLNGNREYLNQLEATETNAQRIASALRAELGGGNAGQSLGAFGNSTPEPRPATPTAAPVNMEVDDPNDPYASTRRALAGVQGLGQRASTSFSQAASSISNAANKATFPPTSTSILSTFNSFMADKDPETTRRANIEKTREKIRSLESERVTHLSKLGSANEAIQKDLDRFQRDKIHDLRNMLLVYAVANRDHAKRCLEAWKVAKEAVGAGEGVHTDGLTNQDLGTW